MRITGRTAGMVVGTLAVLALAGCVAAPEAVPANLAERVEAACGPAVSPSQGGKGRSSWAAYSACRRTAEAAR